MSSSWQNTSRNTIITFERTRNLKRTHLKESFEEKSDKNNLNSDYLLFLMYRNTSSSRRNCHGKMPEGITGATTPKLAGSNIYASTRTANHINNSTCPLYTRPRKSSSNLGWFLSESHRLGYQNEHIDSLPPGLYPWSIYSSFFSEGELISFPKTNSQIPKMMVWTKRWFRLEKYGHFWYFWDGKACISIYPSNQLQISCLAHSRVKGLQGTNPPWAEPNFRVFDSPWSHG